jgi:hypothetical protein
VKEKMESNIVDTVLGGENLILAFNSWQNFVSFKKQRDGSLRKKLETKVMVKVELNVNATN